MGGSSPPEFTLVVGVDRKHLDQLRIVWPTWKKHKPSLLSHPMLIFYDWEQIGEEIRSVIDHPELTIVPWPPVSTIEYEGTPGEKWTCSQRYKMLAGFVHVPAFHVKTPYWLKLDTDVVATGRDDWIDSSWFEENPAIISHCWTFTKPADQILKLDAWVEENKDKHDFVKCIATQPPLNLRPKPGSDRVGHKRIISWCAFFETWFTRRLSFAANRICGEFKLPVPSQDGYVWYCAKRSGRNILRPNMKKRGWQQWLTSANIKKHAEEAMFGEQK